MRWCELPVLTCTGCGILLFINFPLGSLLRKRPLALLLTAFLEEVQLEVLRRLRAPLPGLDKQVRVDLLAVNVGDLALQLALLLRLPRLLRAHPPCQLDQVHLSLPYELLNRTPRLLRLQTLDHRVACKKLARLKLAHSNR